MTPRVIVRLKKAFGNVNAGEVAGFSKTVADDLIKKGSATFVRTFIPKAKDPLQQFEKAAPAPEPPAQTDEKSPAQTDEKPPAEAKAPVTKPKAKPDA